MMFRSWVCVVLVALSTAVTSCGQAGLDGTYRIQVVAHGRFWHEDAAGDKLVSTRSQPNDGTTQFVLEGQRDGSYRIKAKASGRYLHEDSSGDKLLSTRYQPNDDNTRFLLERQQDGSYRIRVKASKRYVHEDGGGDRKVSTRYQSTDPHSSFKLLAVVAVANDSTRPATPPQPKRPPATSVPPTTSGLPPATSGNTAEGNKARMTQLSQQLKAGTYYPQTQAPVDLDGMRTHMLAIGNLARRDPDYRKKHGEKVATDLSGATVVYQGQTNQIIKHRPTPPYFNDLVLNDALNKAAQFHAEYQAFTRRDGHDGPETYNGAPMKEFWQRAQHFGYKFGFEGEGAGKLPRPTDYPENWLRSDTHFRPWFNVNADVVEVGLGIARGADGFWYGCVISGLGK
jgi:uncharacterized protein YkwD